MESGSVDVISSFEDDILAKILCFLPTQIAASTSVLSKRWRNLFPLMNLLFASQHHYYLDDDDSESLYYTGRSKYGFRDFVNKILSGGISVKKLTLKSLDGFICRNHADEWIHKASEVGVVDFELRLVRDANLLPTSLFTNKTLVKLTLGFEFCFYDETIHINIEKVSLPVLKSLVLHTDMFLGKFLYDVVLPGCPILEELALYYKCKCMYFKYEKLWISHKTLKRLTIHSHEDIYKFSFKEFYTPSLVYLDCSGFPPLIHCSTAGFTASLVEAKLDFRKQYNYDGIHFVHMIIRGMRNVKSLSLSSTSVEMMMTMLWSKKGFPLFMKLVNLSFESNREEDWKVLQRLLKKSPNLETLVLRGLHCVGNQDICIDHNNEVKVLKIYGFRGSDEEVRQVKCLLSQMQFLQVMKVEIKANADKKHITDDLLALPKPSSEFQILFL